MFKDQVYNVCKKIPKGKVLTYREITKAVGKPRACRAVGNVLNKNRYKAVPCHRVVRFDGLVGGFNRGRKEKIRLLRSEGVKVADGRVDLKKFLFKFWKGYDTIKLN